MFSAKSWLIVGLILAVFSPVLPAQVAIDQTRLLQEVPPPPPPVVDANGNAIVGTDSTADDSFGAQMILKNQERVRSFILQADASIYYTSNVALTRSATRDDDFAVLNAAGAWTHPLSPELAMLVGLQASAFRYSDASQLDFNDLGAGLGLAWAPPSWGGISMFGRYDFTELIDRHGNEILRDHEFSAGAQKTFPLGRAHAFSLGTLGSVGISTPFAAQRDQVGFFAGYHLQLARSLQTDVTYRIAFQSYSESNRLDLNQVFSWSLRYRLAEWTEVSAFFSFGNNRSNTTVFDYDVITSGGGFGLTTRF